MTDASRVIDERNLPIFIESSLDDYGLEMHEFRVYSRMARRAGSTGLFTESVANAAASCKMSERQFRYALSVLVEARLIRVVDAPQGGTKHYALTRQTSWLKPAALDAIRARVRAGDVSKRPAHKPKSEAESEGGLHDMQGGTAQDADPTPAHDAEGGLHDMQGGTAHGAAKGTPLRYSLEGTPSSSNQLDLDTSLEFDGDGEDPGSSQNQNPEPSPAPSPVRFAPPATFGTRGPQPKPVPSQAQDGITQPGLEHVPGGAATPRDQARRALERIFKGDRNYVQHVEFIPDWLAAHPPEYILEVAKCVTSGTGVTSSGPGLALLALKSPGNTTVPDHLRDGRARLEKNLPFTLEHRQGWYRLPDARVLYVERWTRGAAITDGNTFAPAMTRLWECLPEEFEPDTDAGALGSSTQEFQRVSPERMTELSAEFRNRKAGKQA